MIFCELNVNLVNGSIKFRYAPPVIKRKRIQVNCLYVMRRKREKEISIDSSDRQCKHQTIQKQD